VCVNIDKVEEIMLWSRKAKCIMAARAAGITVVDGVTLAIRDNEACRRDAHIALILSAILLMSY
jgi:citrate lyase beta subunit